LYYNIKVLLKGAMKMKILLMALVAAGLVVTAVPSAAMPRDSNSGSRSPDATQSNGSTKIGQGGSFKARFEKRIESREEGSKKSLSKPGGKKADRTSGSTATEQQSTKVNGTAN
jgi:hypothetical protein